MFVVAQFGGPSSSGRVVSVTVFLKNIDWEGFPMLLSNVAEVDSTSCFPVRWELIRGFCFNFIQRGNSFSLHDAFKS